MKEIALRLTDDIAEFITKEAQEMGITSEELMKYIIGSYVQSERRDIRPHVSAGIIMGDSAGFLKNIFGDIDGLIRKNLIEKAKTGDLTCKNCTMKLSEQDIDNGRCSTCGAPLTEALGGSL